MTKQRAPTRQDLLRRIAELEAGGLLQLKNAHSDLRSAHTDKMMASGVVVSITALGGRRIAPLFLIRDGLSQETITALQADIERSMRLGTWSIPSSTALQS